jgi:hypothetical protein
MVGEPVNFSVSTPETGDGATGRAMSVVAHRLSGPVGAASTGAAREAVFR